MAYGRHTRGVSGDWLAFWSSFNFRSDSRSHLAPLKFAKFWSGFLIPETNLCLSQPLLLQYLHLFLASLVNGVKKSTQLYSFLYSVTEKNLCGLCLFRLSSKQSLPKPVLNRSDPGIMSQNLLRSVSLPLQKSI